MPWCVCSTTANAPPATGAGKGSGAKQANVGAPTTPHEFGRPQCWYDEGRRHARAGMRRTPTTLADNRLCGLPTLQILELRVGPDETPRRLPRRSLDGADWTIQLLFE